MNTYYYLLEANAYLLVFYAFYRLVLQNETFYSFNRFYLLGIAIVSFIMPCIGLSGLYLSVPVEYASVPLSEDSTTWTITNTVSLIYLLIAACFFIRLVFRLYRISQLIIKGFIKIDKGIKIVAINDRNYSFSFMHYLFIHPAEQKVETIIRHEQVHIRQLHSVDILFLELLQIINWFNPFIPFIKKDMKALHEFIADEKAYIHEISARDYALFLIQYSYGALPNNLGNTMFNQSLLKKRIMKLNQKKSPARARLKYMLALLLLPLMLCITAITFPKSYGIIDLMPGDRAIMQDTVKKKRTIPPPPPPVPPKAVKSKSGNIKGEAPPPPKPPKPTLNNVKFPLPAPKPPKPTLNRVKFPLPAPRPPKPTLNQVKFPLPAPKPSKPTLNRVKFPLPAPRPPKPELNQVKFPLPAIVTPKTEKAEIPPPPIPPKKQ